MAVKFKILLKKTLLILLCSLIYLGMGTGIAALITMKFDINLQDSMSLLGLIILIIGILMSMKGNPTGVNISRAGQKDFMNSSYYNFEITRQDRETNPYHKDFMKNNVMEFAFGRLTLIFGGVLLIACSILFF